MTEVRTCNWSDAGSDEPSYTWQANTIAYLAANYVTPDGTLATGNHAHLASTPKKADNGNASFVARVQACVSTALLGSEKCNNYNPDKSDGAVKKWKPVGLLQDFGESKNSGVEAARAEFGLMMGSYDYNLKGGVLRKNMAQMNDEIEATTGRFIGTSGIIKSLNEITLYGYNESTGNYGQNCYSDTITNGSCPSWGNPVGELVLETMRYYANKDAYTSSSSGQDVAVGLVAAARVDPMVSNPAIGTSTRTKLYGNPICRPLNMLAVTSGANSFDDDDYGARFADLNPGSNTIEDRQ
jgi:type IV pilus assembly protein PilY1